MKKISIAVFLLFAAMTGLLSAQEAEPTVNFGNTAWVMMATALVMFMTIPALGLFYGGLVRKKNVLSILMQCFIILGVVSLIWVAFGYSLAFSDTEIIPGVLGDLKWAFLAGIDPGQVSPYYISQPADRIPHLVFIMFQCMFAVITPALIIGAFAERIKFSSFLIFTVLWELIVYIPVAHMVWSANGFLYKLGALDFAGGTVVHVNAGIAALVTTLIIGKRKNLKPIPPHNLPFTLIGAAMLWFGWFGFNAGSSLAADGIAANAFMATNTASAMAALVWAVIDWIVHKKPTILGVATGAVAGLVAVTPAAGFVDVTGAMIIGTIVAAICWVMVAVIKGKAGYDDSLDAFGVHGIGGIVGALLAGILANPAVWKPFGGSYAGLAYGNPGQFTVQLTAVGITMAVSAIGTFLIFKGIDLAIGVKVSDSEESMGLDVTQHNERAYTVVE